MLEFGGETLILTHDMMAEGTHYLPGADMADVAWKLVAVNLSDLAAKGAQPLGVLIGYSLGEGDGRFLSGLRDVLNEFDVPLLGGDTVRIKGPRSMGLTAIGKATYTPVPDRRGAKPGDVIYATGVMGRAMLGFEGLMEHTATYNRPTPLLDEGQALAPHVSAMMDISDGLLLDSWRLAKASDVSIALDSAAIPVADPARHNDCLRWGDDYQLLFTAAPGTPIPVAATQIGMVEVAGPSPLCLDGAWIGDTSGLGYQH